METSAAEKQIWGIHGGRSGEANTLFLQENFVALGWVEMGDLSPYPDRDSLKRALVAAYPGIKPGAIPNNAGQLFRFVHEMEIGDLIVYPSKQDRQIHIGRIEGNYRYNPELSQQYPQQRGVKWLAHVPRTKFSQGALYEIGSALSFFQVKNYAGEFRAAVQGKQVVPKVENDEGVGGEAVAAGIDIEETGADQIAKLISAKFKGHGLATLVEAILKAQGYTTYLSPEGADGGTDILAGSGPLGFQTPQLCVEVKSGDSPIDRPTVDKLLGAMSKFGAAQGLFVSWAGFRQNVQKELASSFFRLRLWTQKEFLENLFAVYDKLDDDLKADLPLKRIWTVAAQEEEG